MVVLVNNLSPLDKHTPYSSPLRNYERTDEPLAPSSKPISTLPIGLVLPEILALIHPQLEPNISIGLSTYGKLASYPWFLIVQKCFN